MNQNTNKETGIKKKLCTVTPFSKFLALILFIALPFIGFWLGRQYPAQPTQTSYEVVTDDSVSENTENAESATENETIGDANTNTNTPGTNTPPAPTPAVSTGPSEMTVYITEITLDNVSVDNIAIYEGNSAIQQMIADGLCTAAEPKKCTLTDGKYYRNTDPTIRTYPLYENVEVQTWTGSEYPLSQLINRTQEKAPYIITISGGVVTKIKEVYR